MMTRKDYIAIAQVIKTATEEHGKARATDAIALALCEVFRNDNQRLFDRERFLAATS